MEIGKWVWFTGYDGLRKLVRITDIDVDNSCGDPDCCGYAFPDTYTVKDFASGQEYSHVDENQLTSMD